MNALTQCPEPAVLEQFLRRELDGAANAEVDRHIEGCSRCQERLDHFSAPSGCGPDTVPSIAEYEIAEEIGRGGMGVVYKARHQRLRRELAVKVMKGELRGNQSFRVQFVAEAQITAQLQHPAIPVVYDIGELADGSPYLAMKLIAGRRLTELLATPSSPGDVLSHLLPICAQVAQAVAYAHSKGVIHRDLKPSNVMVGAFGEVQVMDWGLAKRLEAGPGEVTGDSLPAVREITTIVDEVSTWKTHGAIGTYPYMAPEQALGRSAEIDRRADVFSLGSLLCEMLTGAPAYEGRDVEALRRKAEIGDLTSTYARLESCGADAELIALTRRCLSPEKTDRPQDAGAVAQAVSLHLARMEEKLRSAEMERQAAEIRAEEESKRRQVEEARAREERRRRRLTVGLAASVLLLVVGGGVGAWLVQQQSAEAVARQQRLDDRAAQLLAQARALQGQAWDDADERGLADSLALAQRSREGEVSNAIRAEADTLISEIENKIVRARKNGTLLVALLEVSQPRELHSYRSDAAGLTMVLADISAEQQYASAFRTWGVDVDAEPLEELARRFAEQLQPVYGQVVAGLEGWFRDRQRRKQPEARWRKLLALADALDPDVGRRELRRLRAEGQLSQHRDRLRERARTLHPLRESVLSVVTLADTLSEAGEHRLAEQVLRAALVEQPGEVVLLSKLGKLLKEQLPPRLTEAAECYRAARARDSRLGVQLAKLLMRTKRAEEAEAILKKLGAGQPDHPDLLFYLGNALREQKKLEEAVAAYRKAIAIDPNPAAAHNNLGNALHDQKKLEEAVASYRKTIALDPDLAEAHHNLGTALYDQKKLEEAVAAYRKAIAIDPNLAETHHNLGTALRGLKKLDEAVAAFRKAIALKPEDANAHIGLGNALGDQKKLEEAVAAFRKAIALQPNLAAAHIGLGIILREQKQLDEAVAAFRKAIALKPEEANAHIGLGTALYDQKQLEEAVAAYRKALAIDPNLADAHHNLGTALRGLKKLDEAVAAYRKAIALNPDLAATHYNLGIALGDQKKLEEAVAVYRKAIAIDPNLADAHLNLGNALCVQKKPDEAVAAFRKAIALNPDYALAHNNLGNALYEQKKPDEAVAAYRKAIAINPDYAEAHIGLGAVLGTQKKLDEAVAAFRKAIELNPNHALAHHNLGKALRVQKKLDEAAAAFRKAIELKPDYAQAYLVLGLVLRDQKKLDEAVVAFRKADQLLPNQFVIRNYLRRTERWLELDRQLPAFLAGKVKLASPQEQIELAVLCASYKEHYHAAVRFFADAFRADPKLADDLQAGHRYDAAYAAALAAAGKGTDAGKLDDKEQNRLRQLALDWLLADLKASGALNDKAPQARPFLRDRLAHWLQDTDLSTVREAKSLAALPEKERAAWQQLWADVAALRKKVESKD